MSTLHLSYDVVSNIRKNNLIHYLARILNVWEDGFVSLSYLEIFLLVFASFRLTRLFVFDMITAKIRRLFLEEVEETLADGSKEVYVKVRDGKVRSFFGHLISCYWCTGIWSTTFLLVGYIFLYEIFIYIVIVLAIAGLAAIVEAIVQRLINW